MVTDDEFDAPVDACHAAHEAVLEHGTGERRTFSAAPLHALAKEAARPATAGGNEHDGG